MAAIGGIFNIDGAECSADVLAEMSRAMSFRGGHRRTAYVNDFGGLFSGEDAAEHAPSAHLPRSTSVKGKNVTLVFDGKIFPEGEETAGALPFFGEDGGEFALECYLKYGASMAEHFSGEFTIAIYDEERAHTLLLRDTVGSRPLYCTREENRVCFASEIKGLASATLTPLTVERQKLRAHIFSPCEDRGGKLYQGIWELSPGGGCVISRLGISAFTYTPLPTGKSKAPRQTVKSGFICPDEDGMKKLLAEILFAFDYPQFDILMPTFIRDLIHVKDRGLEYAAAVPDGSLCMDIAYSSARRDRLGILTGARPVCVPPEGILYKERDAKKAENVIKALLSDADREAISHIFGNNWQEDLAREKNTAKRIRAAAMMLQSVFWYEKYNIMLV